MSFRQTLLEMNRRLQNDVTDRKSRHTSRGRAHPPNNLNAKGNNSSSCPESLSSSGYIRSPSYSPAYRGKNATTNRPMAIPVATPQFIYGSPKQFIITKPETSSQSSDDEDFNEESDSNNVSGSDRTPSSDKFNCKHTKQFDKEFFAFCDLDYEMPPEVRQVLQEEGLADATVEAWLRRGEVWHRRAMALRRFQSAKLANAMAKKHASLLPPIKNKSHPTSKQDGDDVTRTTPTLTVDLSLLPDINAIARDGEPKQKMTARDEMMLMLSEADEMRWRAEQQQERILVPVEFVFPRLVIISSKVPWCHAISKTVRKEDGNILSFIYDFETWSFDDILEASRDVIDRYQQGCRVKSIMLLCKGGPGYFYMLRNFVMTPQKMSKPRYKYVRRFWQTLGEMVSKIDAEEAKIHVIGADLESNHQGQKLIRSVLKAIHPNRLDLESPLEHTPRGRDSIELYFDYRKFLLWRSRSESESSFYDAKVEGTRSWSSIEEEIHRRERIQNILNSSRTPD